MDKETPTSAMLRQRITLRLSSGRVCVALPDPQRPDMPIDYGVWQMKGGISEAANLREAFLGCPQLNKGVQRVQVMMCSDVLIVPADYYDARSATEMYLHSFPGAEGHIIESTVLPYLNSVALFSVNKDTNTVLTDHFQEVKYLPAASPVWRQLHKRAATGHHDKLFAYFTEDKVHLMSFVNNRFKFHNVYPLTGVKDSVYFILYVWKLLGLDQQKDELHLVGELQKQEELKSELETFLRKVYVINPAADYNRAPATRVKDMPYDIVTLLTKGN